MAFIPLFSWEFVLIYGKHIPFVEDTRFFVHFGKYFDFEMKNPTAERSVMFIGLMVMYMMLSCLIIESKSQETDKLVSFFKKRIVEPRFS